MAKVRFDEVVKRSNTKVDKNNTHLLYYVGGEHFDSNEITVQRRGIIEGSTIGPMFYFGFKAGQVLVVSRNPHLRKAGVVDFDGICSEKTFVLETADSSILLQEFLPFIVQSDTFWNFAEAHKSGSVNFFVNWSTFAQYEFEMPSIEEQRRLTELLWAMENTKQAYQRLLAKTDELVKAQFVEMFGDPVTNRFGWSRRSFAEFASIDAIMTTDFEKYAEYPHIGIDSIEKDSGVLFGYRSVREDNVISGKYIFTSKHIIYSKIRPNLNKVALPSFDGVCSADAYPILPQEGVCDRVYLSYVLRSDWFLEYIVPFSNRSNMPKVNREQIMGFEWPLPPIGLQNGFASFVKSADQSKLAIQQSLDRLEQTRTALMDKAFG